MRAAKIDANQPEIVKALRKVGAFVQSLASVGKGCPDILAGYRGKWFLLEIKDASKTYKALKPDQVLWILDAMKRAPVHVVETPEQAVQIITEAA